MQISTPMEPNPRRKREVILGVQLLSLGLGISVQAAPRASFKATLSLVRLARRARRFRARRILIAMLRIRRHGRRIEQAPIGIDHVLGIEIGTVVEFHALAQVKGPFCCISIGLPGFREHRHRLYGVVAVNERLVDSSDNVSCPFERNRNALTDTNAHGGERQLAAAQLQFQRRRAGDAYA